MGNRWLYSNRLGWVGLKSDDWERLWCMKYKHHSNLKIRKALTCNKSYVELVRKTLKQSSINGKVIKYLVGEQNFDISKTVYVKYLQNIICSRNASAQNSQILYVEDLGWKTWFVKYSRSKEQLTCNPKHWLGRQCKIMLNTKQVQFKCPGNQNKIL